LIRDLSGGTAKLAVENIDEGKEMINKMFGIQIGPLAKFKMDVSINLPFPNSTSDLSQIENIVPIPSLVLDGCYNKISNNLPKSVDDQEGIGEVIEDHDNAITQEDECTSLLNI